MIIIENYNDILLSKIPFNTRSVRFVGDSSPLGDGFEPIFEERVVDGKKNLVLTGRDDRKAFIEASKNETLIDNIIRRFEMGDVNALSRVQGFYADVTNMPSNLAEAQKILINLENTFNSLPIDVKRTFDNSFDTYVKKVSSFSVEEFNNYFGINKDVDVQKDILESGDNVE